MKEEITYEDFEKLDIRVAEVLVAEAIEESEKLIRLEIDLGAEFGKRQIVAGLKQTHAAEELVGKRIIVLVNLRPRKIMGLLSQGMLLAAESPDGPVLLVLEGDTLPGSTIR